jgi:hypothetical protein
VLADDGTPLVPEPTSRTSPCADVRLRRRQARPRGADPRRRRRLRHPGGRPPLLQRLRRAQALSNPYTGVAAIFASRLMSGAEPLVFEDGTRRATSSTSATSRARARSRSASDEATPRAQPRHRKPTSVLDVRRARQGLGVEIEPRILGSSAPATSATATRTRRGRGAPRLPRRGVLRGRHARPPRLARDAGATDQVDAAYRALAERKLTR